MFNLKIEKATSDRARCIWCGRQIRQGDKRLVLTCFGVLTYKRFACERCACALAVSLLRQLGADATLPKRALYELHALNVYGKHFSDLPKDKRREIRSDIQDAIKMYGLNETTASAIANKTR